MKNESKTESISEIRPESKENAAVEFADGIKIIRNIPYTEERETRNCYDLYLPAEEGTDTEAPQTLVIYFYGGSLKKGCKDKQAFPGALIRELRERGAVHGSVAVACPDYRLIPDVMYPTFINDAAEAVRAATERYSAEYGIPKRIFIAISQDVDLLFRAHSFLNAFITISKQSVDCNLCPHIRMWCASHPICYNRHIISRC